MPETVAAHIQVPYCQPKNLNPTPLRPRYPSSTLFPFLFGGLLVNSRKKGNLYYIGLLGNLGGIYVLRFFRPVRLGGFSLLGVASWGSP